MLRTLVILVVAIGQAPELFGQSHPDAEWIKLASDAKQRRATRELAVKKVGQIARPLVEEDYGDEGALALLRCSPKAAASLCQFHASGGLSRLYNSSEVLLIIAQSWAGDEVCGYVVTHEKELAEPVCSALFCRSPMEFSLRLKSLAAAGAERRAYSESLRAVTPSDPMTVPERIREVAPIAGLFVLLGLVLWAKRKRMSSDPA